MRTTDTYLLRAITNMHPGSGQADFGIIDKHVQRDPVTGLPIIFASSLKGSLRELFSVHQNAEETKIFGSDSKATTLSQGEYRFFDAFLLSLPIRSSKHFYYPATCPELISDFIAHLTEVQHPEAESWARKLAPISQLGVSGYTGDAAGEVRMENHRIEHVDTQKNLPDQIEAAIKQLHKLLQTDRVAILSATNFQRLAKDLPTVARNHLNNGISDNLWYEEIIPRETRFYCSVARPNQQSDPLVSALNNGFKNTIQIGGNATVGYGVCKMTKIEA